MPSARRVRPPQPSLEEGARRAAQICAGSGASRSRRDELTLRRPRVATTLPSRRWRRDQTVGTHAYSLSAAVGLRREAASWCESNIFALAQVVVNPRAVVGPQNAWPGARAKRGRPPLRVWRRSAGLARPEWPGPLLPGSTRPVQPSQRGPSGGQSAPGYLLCALTHAQRAPREYPRMRSPPPPVKGGQHRLGRAAPHRRHVPCSLSHADRRRTRTAAAALDCSSC